MCHARRLGNVGMVRGVEEIGRLSGLRRRIWKRLESLVGAKTVANEEDKSFCRCSFLLNPIRCHTMDNGTDEVYIEDRVQVNQVEDHGEGQKPCTPNSGHVRASWREGVTVVRYP